MTRGRETLHNTSLARRMNPSASLPLVALANLLLVSQGRAQVICAPAIQPAAFSRVLPHTFVDQALESIPHTSPGAQVLVSRRTGRLGAIDYGLIVYRPSPTADSVLIEGVAVDVGATPQAWDFATTCSLGSWPEGLLRTLEAVSQLK
jgi:hypothetical protein